MICYGNGSLLARVYRGLGEISCISKKIRNRVYRKRRMVVRKNDIGYVQESGCRIRGQGINANLCQALG